MSSARRKAASNVSTLYNYHLVLGHLNKRKLFVLNGVPRFIVNPYSVMPRNYLTNNDTCEIRYNKSTNYPWSMMFVDWRRADAFPAFTPVVPEPIQYIERDYDQTEVYVHSQDPAVIAERLQQQQQSGAIRPPIPTANDYENSIAVNRTEQFEGLPLSGYQPAIMAGPLAEQTICQQTKANNQVKFVLTNNPDQFFAANENERPAPLVPEQNIMQSYLQYLNSQGGTVSGSGTGTDLNAVPVTADPGPTPMDVSSADDFGVSSSSSGFGGFGQQQFPDSTTSGEVPVD